MSNHTLTERPSRKDHLCLDYEKLLNKSICGVMDEIEQKLYALNKNGDNVYPNYEEMQKREFYTCLLIELKAVLELAQRYSKAAYELALKSDEPRKSELLALSKIIKKCRHIHPPPFGMRYKAYTFFFPTFLVCTRWAVPTDIFINIISKILKTVHLQNNLPKSL